MRTTRMDYWLRPSNQFLESVTLAAIEAYCYGDGRDNPEIETVGYIWGSKKCMPGRTVLFLDRIGLSLSAERDHESVTHNPRAAILMNNVIELWSLHLLMIGHFHTHPYKNLKEAQSCKGWEFSSANFRFAKRDDLSWEKSEDTPVMLAVTICHMGKVHETPGRAPADVIFQSRFQ